MYGTIKKLQLHTYMDSNYTLSLTFIFNFFLISFEYTHEFTLSFFLFWFIEFSMIYLYYTLCFLHLINSSRTKTLKI